MIKKLTTLFILLFLNGFSFSQKLDTFTCKATVLEYNKKMTLIGHPKKGKVYSLNYRQQVNYWDPKTKNLDLNIKYFMSKKKAHIITNELKTYMDENYVFTIIEKQKKIILTLNPKNISDENSLKLFLENQKFIIVHCPVSQCTIDKEKNVKKIVLDANGINITSVKADKLVYYFDAKSDDLLKTVTTYNKGYPIRRLSITVNEMNFNSSYRFPENLYSQFLDAKGKLKPKYNGYQLITE